MAEEKQATLINDAGIPEEAPEQEEKNSPSPAPQEIPSETEEKEWVYIQIKPGETLESLSEKYERPPEKILEKNKIHPVDVRFGYWIFV